MHWTPLGKSGVELIGTTVPELSVEGFFYGVAGKQIHSMKMGGCIWESGFNSTEKTDEFCTLDCGKFRKKEKLWKAKIN